MYIIDTHTRLLLVQQRTDNVCNCVAIKEFQSNDKLPRTSHDDDARERKQWPLHFKLRAHTQKQFFL